MSNNITENNRKASEAKAQKRAAALRENLKRRKNSEAAKVASKGNKDAKPDDGQ
jgi:hypothetical protein